MSRVWAYAAACDLRRGYNGLYAMAVNELDRDPMEGDTFVFTNRRRNSCKILRHDGTGLTIEDFDPSLNIVRGLSDLANPSSVMRELMRSESSSRI